MSSVGISTSRCLNKYNVSKVSGNVNGKTMEIDAAGDGIRCPILSLNQRLLNALRRFDKFLRKTLNSSMAPLAATPHDVAAGDNIICLFLEETRLGRGLRVVVDVMREMPRSIEAQSLAVAVIYNCLTMMLEVRHAQRVSYCMEPAKDIKKNDVIFSNAPAELPLNASIQNWVKFRDALGSSLELSQSTQRINKSPTSRIKEKGDASLRATANPLAKLQSTTMKYTTITQVLAVLDQNLYGKVRKDADNPRSCIKKNGYNEDHDADGNDEIKVGVFQDAEDESESLHLGVGGAKITNPRPPPHWLPGTPSSKLEDFRSLGQEQTWARFGRPLQWLDVSFWAYFNLFLNLIILCAECLERLS